MSTMRNFLIRVVRDNEFANSVGRRLVKNIVAVIKPLNKLTSMYRVYGTVRLRVDDIEFKIFGKADDHIATDLFYNRDYEKGEFRLLKQLVKHSKLMVDIGANTGIFSIYAAKINSKLEVLSFEPHPSNYQRLLTNVSINKLDNIRPYDYALGPDDAEIEFTVPADMSISTTSSVNGEFTRNFHKMEYLKVPVRQKKLDDILAKVPLTSSDVFKIDVEYYELQVLKGAEATLKNKRPIIIIELLNYDILVEQFPEMKNKVTKSHVKDVIDFLTNIGYQFYSISPDGLYKASEVRNGRNFLFVPYKLAPEFIAFEEILTEMTKARN